MQSCYHFVIVKYYRSNHKNVIKTIIVWNGHVLALSGLAHVSSFSAQLIW